MNAFDLKLSPEALSWIKQLEGFTPKAQELLDGRFVIGFGHIEQTDPDEILTELEADLLLRMDLAKIESLLGDHLTSEIRSEQWDGLVMLAFAVGAEEIACSEIIMQINLGNFSRAARHFLDYSASLVGGKLVPIDALEKRRVLERAIFMGLFKEEFRVPRGEIQALPLLKAQDPVIVQGVDNKETISGSRLETVSNQDRMPKIFGKEEIEEIPDRSRQLDHRPRSYENSTPIASFSILVIIVAGLLCLWWLHSYSDDPEFALRSWVAIILWFSVTIIGLTLGWLFPGGQKNPTSAELLPE